MDDNITVLRDPTAAYAADSHKHSELTERIIRSYFEVYNALGHGFLEKVYENAMVVDDLIILELKAVEALALEHEAQLINYLKATRYEVGLLLNFGPRPKIIRKAYANERKSLLAE